jgi:5-methylcytosine-specific restriction endonuclease McrA
MEEYAERNEILFELGFRDYARYLRSRLWKDIRARKLEQDPECYGCGRGDDKITLQVHHGKYTYDNLAGNTLADLYTVCARCHHWIEVTRAGYKRNPEDATKELHRLRKLYALRQNNKPDIPRIHAPWKPRAGRKAGLL